MIKWVIEEEKNQHIFPVPNWIQFCKVMVVTDRKSKAGQLFCVCKLSKFIWLTVMGQMIFLIFLGNPKDPFYSDF